MQAPFQVGGVWRERRFLVLSCNLLEDDEHRFMALPHEFFRESTRCKHTEFVVEMYVHEEMTYNVGGQRFAAPLASNLPFWETN